MERFHFLIYRKVTVINLPSFCQSIRQNESIHRCTKIFAYWLHNRTWCEKSIFLVIEWNWTRIGNWYSSNMASASASESNWRIQCAILSAEWVENAFCEIVLVEIPMFILKTKTLMNPWWNICLELINCYKKIGHYSDMLSIAVSLLALPLYTVRFTDEETAF
jgi:hypothetical protein